MRDVYEVAALILAGLLLYRFRGIWLDGLRRFDERNRARIAQEQRDRADPTAHFRHTLEAAGEEVEQVYAIEVPDGRTGDPVTRYVFGAEKFATREEAEEARNIVVVAKARLYYRHLPAQLAARKEDDRLH